MRNGGDNPRVRVTERGFFIARPGTDMIALWSPPGTDDTIS